MVLKSTYHGRLDVDASMLVVDEITVVGSRCGPFPAALELLREGLDPSPLVERVLPARSLSEAFELASVPGVMKVLVDFTKL
ncbi:MAG: hypothetical protein D6806_10600 [Deltaproteobacteria bacterium]|nr:MAG: hypothetical protein D6806_10600 [Deltaproteobacteria bacterium]